MRGGMSLALPGWSWDVDDIDCCTYGLGHWNMGLGDLEGVTRLAMDDGTSSRG